MLGWNLIMTLPISYREVIGVSVCSCKCPTTSTTSLWLGAREKVRITSSKFIIHCWIVCSTISTILPTAGRSFMTRLTQEGIPACRPLGSPSFCYRQNDSWRYQQKKYFGCGQHASISCCNNHTKDIHTVHNWYSVRVFIHQACAARSFLQSNQISSPSIHYEMASICKLNSNTSLYQSQANLKHIYIRVLTCAQYSFRSNNHIISCREDASHSGRTSPQLNNQGWGSLLDQTCAKHFNFALQSDL